MSRPARVTAAGGQYTPVHRWVARISASHAASRGSRHVRHVARASTLHVVMETGEKWAHRTGDTGQAVFKLQDLPVRRARLEPGRLDIQYPWKADRWAGGLLSPPYTTLAR
eukprot:2064990-Prymnesium_polylepis.1